MTHARSIYITLSTLMIGMIVLLYGALAAFELHASKQQMLRNANETFARVAREAVAAVEAEFQPARVTVRLLARTSLLSGTTQAERLSRAPLMAEALRANPAVCAVYAGAHNGSFILMRRLNTPAQKLPLHAPTEAAFLIQTVNRDGLRPVGEFRFYDAALQLLEARNMPDYTFDPRGRIWATEALAAAGQQAAEAVIRTDPYRFYTNHDVGVTFASATPAKPGEAGFGGVVGMDLSLQSLTKLLDEQHITPSSQLMLTTLKGTVLAHHVPGAPIDKAAADAQAGTPHVGTDPAGTLQLTTVGDLPAPPLRAQWQRRQDNASSNADLLSTVEGREWVMQSALLPNSVGEKLSLTLAAPRDELQADALREQRIALLITAGIALLMLPLVHASAQLVSRPLKRLAQVAEAIRRFDFSTPAPKNQLILEVNQLAEAMEGMKQTLQRFLEISSALSAERDFDTLLDRLLAETISVAEANGGTLHLLSADEQSLEPAAARLHNAVAPSTDTTAGSANKPALQDWLMQRDLSASPPWRAWREGRLVSEEFSADRPDHASQYGFLFKQLQCQSLRIVALPLKNRQDEMVGTLSLCFVTSPANDKLNAAPALSAAHTAFIEALSGTAAVAIDNQLLMRARKDLLESFIQMVAGAIDAKSPYTGAHCQRVPALTKLLAQAACEASSGPYANFRLDAEEWEALHIAAWLHDCGKVTTPEYVVDKATKLETVHNRIHEVRLRFELIKRELELAHCAQLLRAHGVDAEQALQDLAPELARVDDDFAFVAQCNVGGEFMAPDKVERLNQIAQRRWTRTLDDRLGLSIEEHQRVAGQTPQALPVQEPLLADRPEHIVPRAANDLLDDNNAWGFNMHQPEHLYNRGELHNLSIRRGTLTEEERYKINDHIVQTIKMLSALPLPRHLRSVPELAGGHHEKMDGTGYPRGLKGEAMSPVARMMAIADIFEALTANDRPYKKGKRLSEALQIMAYMRKDQHIDAELFALFLRSGVYLRYAQEHLQPEQLDDIDITHYL
ncbi:HD domain-containing phosphohydrolase [Roseateles koreensis]|uniref:HD domain-containing protein n=1 Tax=Roseateles koreensis TaxID=2987526 RepID=A0ABT5KRQ8_9BURK|nr:HD domain-containing phosphohydrolase [Roseateles koreensis]MDC8785569.1 HD domain-containing protein [Roseateles koreensis]